MVVCKDFAEADLLVYANVNYVSMDGGYKSYATVWWCKLKHVLKAPDFGA